MLRDSFELQKEYQAIENAIQAVLDGNYRTADIMEEGKIKVGCKKMAQLIADAI